MRIQYISKIVLIFSLKVRAICPAVHPWPRGIFRLDFDFISPWLFALIPYSSAYFLFRLMHTVSFLTLPYSSLSSLRSPVILFLPSSPASHSLTAHPNCTSSQLKGILCESSGGTDTLSTTSSSYCQYLIIQYINGRHIESQ